MTVAYAWRSLSIPPCWLVVLLGLPHAYWFCLRALSIAVQAVLFFSCTHIFFKQPRSSVMRDGGPPPTSQQFSITGWVSSSTQLWYCPSGVGIIPQAKGSDPQECHFRRQSLGQVVVCASDWLAINQRFLWPPPTVWLFVKAAHRTQKHFIYKMSQSVINEHNSGTAR